MVIDATHLGSVRKRSQSQPMYSTRAFVGISDIPYDITRMGYGQFNVLFISFVLLQGY
jgi:hypothetical protein